MSGLVFRDLDGEKVVYSGSQFDGLENDGSKHLCVRTGIGDSGIKKYGLTSAPLNDRYSKMKMRISAGEERRLAYIAQKYSVSSSSVSKKTKTTTRSSSYISSSTKIDYQTKTSSKSLTTTMTNSYIGLQANKSIVSKFPYVNNNDLLLSGESLLSNNKFTLYNTQFFVITGTMSIDDARFINDIGSFARGSFAKSFSSYLTKNSLTYGTTKRTFTLTNICHFFTNMAVYISSDVHTFGRANITFTENLTLRCNNNLNYPSNPRAWNYKLTDRRERVFFLTETKTSFLTKNTLQLAMYGGVSAMSSVTFTNHITETLTTKSSSSLSTKTATRISSYISSETITTSSSKLTNNVNL